MSLAERLIPATDVSNQISTAGYEASGTSNMKFMMNGALTLGTRDGATIEMAEEAGEENFFLFGLTAQEVADCPRLVQPVLAHAERTGNARRGGDGPSPKIGGNGVDASSRRCANRCSRAATGTCTWRTCGRTWKPTARLTDLYDRPDAWARTAILNVASSGKFSSDRTIAQYAADIWDARPCPVK